jgi:hypothetical protein
MADFITYKGHRMTPQTAKGIRLLSSGLSHADVAEQIGTSLTSIHSLSRRYVGKGVIEARHKRRIMCARAEDGTVYRFDGREDIETRGGFAYGSAYWAAANNKRHGGLVWWMEDKAAD